MAGTVLANTLFLNINVGHILEIHCYAFRSIQYIKHYEGVSGRCILCYCVPYPHEILCKVEVTESLHIDRHLWIESSQLSTRTRIQGPLGPYTIVFNNPAIDMSDYWFPKISFQYQSVFLIRDWQYKQTMIKTGSNT